jgi:8-oxo-dGTP diphosphatase
MKIRPCAVIIVADKLLTLKYNYNGNLLYALPGGNLEFGEKLEDALQRELHEEIGLEIKVGALLHIAEVHQTDKDTLHCIFLSEIASGEAELNPLETSALEIVWIPIREIMDKNLYPNVKFPLHQRFVENQEIEVFLGEINQLWF